MRTPENLIKHELIGLNCRIAGAKNKSIAGIRGIVVDETMKTLTLETKTGNKIVAKNGTTFEFELNDKAVLVNGDYIFGRPEDRIKKKIIKW